MTYFKSSINICCIVISALCLLNGCAARHETPVVVVAPKGKPAPAEKLSNPEIEALESTGSIDSNVPPEEMAEIARQYKHYLRKGRKSMCAMSKQSEQYLAYAKKVFRNKGMPEDLANLAIVESGYKPEAVSRAGAAGAWQFMPATGLKYGLEQDEWLDERLDPWKATEAAAQYLNKLYKDFGDWPTAIAAYNAGEGKLQRAKEMTGGRNFFEVKAMNHVMDEKSQLREETKNYVPRFMAVSKIMRNLAELGFEPIDPDNADTVMRFKAKPGTDLRDLSRACQLKWEEFAAYNRHHKRAITCIDRETFVYVPAKAEKLAASYLCETRPANFANWKFVKVANANDSLEKISKRANVPLERLQAANPGLGKLKIGQTVFAPTHALVMAKAQKTSAPEVVNQIKKEIKKAGTTHAIGNGETLYSIAKKYNVDVRELMACNQIANPSALRKGQRLEIPDGSKERQPAQGGSSGSIGKKSKNVYVVRKNDNLWKIANMHKISVEDLKRWNNIDEKMIHPGSVITVSR